MELLSDAGLKYIISRVLDNAKDAKDDYTATKNEFSAGKRLAYYEILDTIKNELIIHDADIEKFLLDFDLDKEL